MIDQLKKIFGGKPAEDFAQLVKEGAQIIDVRTTEEYASGHIRGSINIPLHDLPANIGKIGKEKSVILCCASGMRSGSAKNMLKSKGYTKVYNGGGWRSLQSKIK